MLQNPSTGIIGSHIPDAGIINHLGPPKGNQFAVAMRRVQPVIWCMRHISPNILTTLMFESRVSEIGVEEYDRVLQHTLIHMLALPAQLRNNFLLSFREKNRSRTKNGAC